jgi:hypothetical protein
MKLRDVLGWMEVGELKGVDTPHGLSRSRGESIVRRAGLLRHGLLVTGVAFIK